MPEYNWPSKIRRYKLTSPFHRFLVVKYESVIDWNGARIETAEALDRHVRETMLPKLRQRIDPRSPTSHYCRSINLAHMLQNPAPHIDEARRIRDQDGEAAARTFLLNHINEHKKQAFEAWWSYLTEGNPTYTENPAFQYLMLRPVIDSSDAKCTRSPVNPDAESLAHLFDGILTGTLDPKEKLLKTLCEFMAFGSRQEGVRPAFGTACGWVMIGKDMAKSADRVAALAQGTGWCVASPSMAASYLRRSDFHILVENGQAVAAIRTNISKALEIQGKGNRDPGDWWPRIILYCKARAISIEARKLEADSAVSRYQNLLAAIDSSKDLAIHLARHPAQVQFLSAEIVEDENYHLVIEEAWLACVKADPLCSAMSPSWMPRDGKLDAMLLEGWRNLMELDPTNVMRLPDALQHHTNLAWEKWLSWGLLLQSNPKTYDACPPDLQTDPDLLSARKKGWLTLFNTTPRETPSDLQDDPDIIAALKAAWESRIGKNIDSIIVRYCPQRIVEPILSNMQPSEPDWFYPAISDILRKEPTLTFHLPRWLRTQPQMTDVIHQVMAKEWPESWARLKKGITPYRTVYFWKDVPKRLRDHPALVKQYEENWLTYCRRFPAQIMRCPEDLMKKERFLAEVKENVTRYLCDVATRRKRAHHLLTRWKKTLRDKIPISYEELRLLVEALCHQRGHETHAPQGVALASISSSGSGAPPQQKTKVYWQEIIQQNPIEWNICPSSLKHTPEILLARTAGWMLYAENHRSIAAVPEDILAVPETRTKIIKIWQRQKDLSATEWLKCPEFVVADNPGIRNRISAAITRSLRRGPSFWLKLPSYWRQKTDLQQEAAECWAQSPDLHDKDPPEDIRERVKALINP